MDKTPQEALALALDPAQLFTAANMDADDWQKQVLRSTEKRILLNCSRQAGKSTTIAAMALHCALFQPGALILLLSRAQRQATELFRKVLDFYTALGRPIKPIAESVLKLEMPNGSRIIALPGKEANIRSYSGVDLLVIDEAARVPEDLYRSVRPMLAVSGGRMALISTPFGRRGFFYHEWADKDNGWLKIQIDAKNCPRITEDFLAEELRTMGESWYKQEYMCSFESLEGLVYPNFDQCRVDIYTPEGSGRLVGGIDWGWANPFAAIWGVLDEKDVLWIQNERYERNTPLHKHAQALPRGVKWYADPAGRTEIEEFRVGNFVVQAGDNSLRAGIAAVQARIQTGRLKVLWYKCPNLIEEAGLYRYPRPDERAIVGENPIDDSNHALGALRYLVSRLDHKFMVKFRRGLGTSYRTETESPDPDQPPDEVQTTMTRRQANQWLDINNPELWTPID